MVLSWKLLVLVKLRLIFIVNLIDNVSLKCIVGTRFHYDSNNDHNFSSCKKNAHERKPHEKLISSVYPILDEIEKEAENPSK
jgi:hypothetical protein